MLTFASSVGFNTCAQAEGFCFFSQSFMVETQKDFFSVAKAVFYHITQCDIRVDLLLVGVC